MQRWPFAISALLHHTDKHCATHHIECIVSATITALVRTSGSKKHKTLTHAVNNKDLGCDLLVPTDADQACN